MSISKIDLLALQERHPDLAHLHENQWRVVIWCYENGKAPMDAVHAGLIAESTLFRWGTTADILGWVRAYAKRAPKYNDEVNDEMAALVPDALAAIKTALLTGTISREVADLAKHVLKHAAETENPRRYTDGTPSDSPDTPAEDDGLDNLIQMAGKK